MKEKLFCIFFLCALGSPLGPAGLMLAQHFQNKCGSAALLLSGKNTEYLTMYLTESIDGKVATDDQILNRPFYNSAQ